MSGATHNVFALAASGDHCAVAHVVDVDADSGTLRVATFDAPDRPLEAEALRGAFGAAPPASGDRVLVLFPAGASLPVVVGCIGPAAARDVPEDAVSVMGGRRPTVARVDGSEVRLTAQRSISLECGKASITLTRDGKVTIRGAEVVSRAAGANKVKGGSVKIN